MAFFRASIGGGGGGGGGYDYKTTDTFGVNGGTKVGTISGLTIGKSYYLFACFAWTNSNFNANVASVVGADNFTTVSTGVDVTNANYTGRTCWGLYTFKATSTSLTITFANTPVYSGRTFNLRYLLFEK